MANARRQLEAEADDHLQAVALAASTNVPVRRRKAGSREKSKPSGSPGLLTYDTLPEYLQDNEFIQTGYRYDLPLKDTVKSLFNLHNETGNVWSHLIGFIVFVGLTVWVSRSPPTPAILARPQLDELWHAIRSNMHHFTDSVGENLHQLQESLPRLPNLQTLQHTVHQLQGSLQDSWQHGVHSLSESVHSLSESVHSLQDQVQQGAHALAGQLRGGVHGIAQFLPRDVLSSMSRGLQWPIARWPMYVFCAGAMSCLLLSAVCHLFGCCKKHIALMIWRLDYAGIALLIVSSFYPIVYYAFLCQPVFSAAYMAVISVLGAAAIAMSLLEVFQRSEWRTTRAGLYVGLGCMGVVPIIHVLALHYDVWHVRSFVVLDLLMGASYLSGAAIYALRIPERWFPGKFDILLHSHQIFHFCVVVGALIHYRAALLLLEWRDASGGCAVPVTQGPLSRVLDDLSAAGHDLLHIDQVWEWLRATAAEHLHLVAAASHSQQVGPPLSPTSHA